MEKELKDIWQDFIDGKIDQNPGIRDEVFESWLRSRALGINPYMEKAPIELTGSALNEELERKKEFLLTAMPVIENLYSSVKGTSSGVWVSNENGIILKSLADPDVSDLCENDNLVIGANWSEEKVGNNAIGTALFLRRPVQFVQAEHYRKKAHLGCCAAAPIIGHSGEIVGVLDMTGFSNTAHPHTLGMVVAGAAAIQRELLLITKNQEIRLAHQYLLGVMDSLPTGIMVINSKGIITSINHQICELLRSPAEYFVNHSIFERFEKVDCIRKILLTGKEVDETEYYYKHDQEKLHFTISCRPIKNNKGFLEGAVLIFRKIEDVRRMTGKMVGYKARFDFKSIVGEDQLFKKVIDLAKAAAVTSSNILILGESGTGKEVLAQAIHNASRCSTGPFVAINCGALPRELIGSELFGYEEGAFTGAKKGGSPGKFELANNGTLFLDEIGDMPLDLQLLLIRVLQEKVVVRLGGRQEIPVNVRIIAATNKNLKEMVANKLFRQDLYYRLNVINLTLPSLRQRKGDIAILANHFLQMQSKKLGKEILDIDSQLLAKLEQYNWPGNIRELQNFIERAVVFEKSSSLQIDYLEPIVDINTGSYNSSKKDRKTDLLSL